MAKLTRNPQMSISASASETASTSTSTSISISALTQPQTQMQTQTHIQMQRIADSVFESVDGTSESFFAGAFSYSRSRSVVEDADDT